MPFKGLSILSVVFKVVAWGALAIGLLGAGSVLFGGTEEAPMNVAGALVLGGLLNFGIFFALGGILQLLLKIEAQTRSSGEGH